MNQMIKINYFSCVMVIVIILSALTQAHEDEPQEDYYNGVLEPQLLHQLMQQQQQQQYLSTDKRSCVRRGGPCDHNTKCCNALCKCNLWGTNCRCQRQGLFQKWGR